MVTNKHTDKHTDKQTDKHTDNKKQTNNGKYNIGLGVCPVEYGGRPLYVLIQL